MIPLGTGSKTGMRSTSKYWGCIKMRHNSIPSPGRVNHVFSAETKFNPHDEFHTYAFEWTPEYIAWFIDGVEIHRQSGNHIRQLNRAQKLMMNIWPPQYMDWVGELKSYYLPIFAYYDWVEYYEYTPTQTTTMSAQPRLVMKKLENLPS
ncbi:family 16 glycosylhydrolase [candidate division KSB1 bacterium]|nr:family 16 glycosylhydrolase [candidate division KSB1 bacterium]